MGNVILCQTQEGKEPYVFENARIEVYSYEELCYYIYYNIPILDENAITQKLIQWVEEELKLKELANQIKSELVKGESLAIYQTILSYRSFFTKEEIEVFVQSFLEYQLLSPFEKQKKKADSFLFYKRYMKAFHIYETIALQMEEKTDLDQDEKIFLGNLYHNMAVCQGKNLEWEPAKENFRKAFFYNKNTESLKEYFFLLSLSSTAEEKEAEEKRYCLPEEFFLDIQDEIEDSEKEITGMEIYKKFQYAIYNKEHGKYQDYCRRMDAMLEQWKMELKEQWI